MINWQRIWNDDGSNSRYSPAKTIAYILSLIYRLVIVSWSRLYDSQFFPEVRLSCPVISVGNITVGGTGKTPCVIWLAQILQKNGYKPAVLSRGYGSLGSRPVNIVSDGRNILLAAAVAGDEPLLMARTLPGIPVITGPKRVLTGRTAIDEFGVNVLLCDDAFQHRQIYRDINILLLDSLAPLGNNHLLPRGPLREPASALGRADVIIATRCEVNGEPSSLIAGLARTGNIPLFRSIHRPCALVRGDYALQLPLSELRGKKIYAFAGIGKPSSFKKSILDSGAQVVSFDIFPDHHCYNRRELEKISNNFSQSGADLILTTEKDAMRLQEFTDFIPTIYLLRIAMEIVPDEAALENHLLEKLVAGKGAF
jgi:tetraacyldisaccharide 4'-kinase